MAERDRAAVDVDAGGIELELADTGDRLSRERFVQLDLIDLVDRQSGPLQDFLRRGNRPQPHAARVHAGDGGGDYARQWLRPPSTALDRPRPPGGEEEGGGAVVDPARAGRPHRAPLLECRLQL